MLLVFSPAIYLAWLVRRYSVDIGCWDMWENAPLLEKWKAGALTWGDLYAAQIQHRIVVPRLLIILLHTLSGGNFRWENYFTVGLLLSSGVLTYRLLRATLGNSGWVPGIAFVANLLIFSPMLYQNVLWGSSMWMALPLTCLLLALTVLRTGWPFWLKIVAAGLLAEVGTHSFAHGLGLWPTLAVYVMTQPLLGRIPRRLAAAAALAIVGAGTIAFYLHNLVNQAFHAYNLKPGDYALSGNVVESPREMLTVVLGFLGTLHARSPWAFSPPIERAPYIGCVVLAVFVICVVVILFTRRGRAIWPQALPWLALASYVFGVGMMIGFGRAHIGEFRAVTTRYLVVSVFFWISTAVLVVQLLSAWAATWTRLASHEKLSRIGVSVLTMAAVLQLPNWAYGFHLTKIWNRARLQAKALVLFIDHLPWQPNKGTHNVVDKSQDYARDAIHRLRRIGLFRPKVLESPDLRWFDAAKQPLPSDKAGVESATLTDAHQIEITGHARFGFSQPADLVLFALPPHDLDHRVIGLGQPITTPVLRLYSLDYEFANAEPLPATTLFRWKAVIDPSLLPAEGARLEIWALDVGPMKVTRLQQSVDIRKPDTASPAVQILND